MNNKVKLIFLLVLTMVSMTVSAQSAGDKLYRLGQKFQKKITLQGQKDAISYYKKAKEAYDSAENRSKCDNQIEICKNTIKAAPWDKKVIIKDDKIKGDNKVKEKDELEKLEVDTTKLSMSKSTLEFNSKQHTETIKVECNRMDWEISNDADWISITRNGDEVTLSIQQNKGEEDRTTILKAQCGKVSAQLKITQYKYSTIWQKGYKKVVGK